MDGSYIFDAPPLPPPPVTRVTGGNRGRQNGARRGQHAQRPRFQPAMQLDSTLATSRAPAGPSGLPSIVSPPVNAGDQTIGHVTTPIHYNAEGYALSSTYNHTEQPDLHVPQNSLSMVPAPRIQGTNISLDTPEDIAAWIAERKKKWPTDANVERNKAERARKTAQRPNKKRKIDARRVEQREVVPVTIAPRNDSKIVEDDAVQTKQVAASSLDIALAALSAPMEEQDGDVVESHDAPIRDEPLIPPSMDKDATTSSTTSSASSDSEASSSDTSDSEDSSDDDAPAAESSKVVLSQSEATMDPVVPARTAKPRVTRPCKYFRQGRCSHGDNCTFSHANGPSKPKPARQNVKVDDRYKWRKRKSLFDRLVENEVAREEEEAERTRLAAEAQAGGE